MKPRLTTFLLCAVALLSPFAASAQTINIERDRVLWGFDGQATANSFNIVSILVDNPTPEPFDHVIELREQFGTGQDVGAGLVQEVYIAPFSSRWVQYYPYIKNVQNEWYLRWGRGAGTRFDLPEPRVADQTPVLFVEPNGLSGRGDSLKHFPEDLFPPTVTATDALRDVVLDHVPRWEESRRQAFLDWLHLGGRVHLVKDVTGEYPKFSTGLAELNAPLERFQVGSGEVIRHDRSRGQLDREFVSGILGKPSGEAGSADTGNDPNTPRAQAAYPYPNYDDPDLLFGDFSGGILSSLKNLTIPKHSWELIYFLAVLYVLAIFPGLFLLGRRRIDYRIVYGTLAGVVVLFSLGFAHVGRRGHGEITGINTLVVARQLPEGALDVSGWSNIFVTDGDDYRVSHTGSGRLYSAAESYEKVRGDIISGAEAGFVVDIPPFSSRPFVHREKTKQEPLEFEVVDFAGEALLKKFTLKPGANFPKPVDGFVYLLYHDYFYKLGDTLKDKLNAETETKLIQWSGSRAEHVSGFFGSIDADQFSTYRFNNRFWYNEPQADPSPDAVFNGLMLPLMAHSLGIERHSHLPNFKLTSDSAKLFVWAELPESLQVDNPQLGRQRGRVLYVVDIPKPVTP